MCLVRPAHTAQKTRAKIIIRPIANARMEPDRLYSQAVACPPCRSGVRKWSRWGRVIDTTLSASWLPIRQGAI